MNKENKTELSSYFVTPDSVRKTLQFLKSFNDCHTGKNYGYEDIEGSKYSGIIENFGSELLIESRKLRTDKPLLENVYIDNNFRFYFEIQYSNLINSYDQQNMLVATIRKDVFLENKEYRIRFENCKNKYVLRSDSWSDPKVYKDKFAHTHTPPTLIISDKDNPDDVEEIPLCIYDKSGLPSDYYYHINNITQSMVSEYDEDAGVLFTKELTNSMSGSPMIWFCVDALRTLPNIGFKNNDIDKGYSSHLSVGINGHNVSGLYPLVHHTGSLAYYEYIMAKFITDTNINGDDMYNLEVESIYFVNCEEDDLSNHKVVREIYFDHSSVKLTLSRDVEWIFNKNDNSAYVSLNKFGQNIPYGNHMIPAFIMVYNKNFLHSSEILCRNAVTGIHVDSSSEYSDNGIFKKNGVIRYLGDFDGLPKYFHYLLDRTIHRSHMELYTIRDTSNNLKCKPNEKQTCALILDSGVPNNEVNDLMKDLNVVIKYDTSSKMYVSEEASVSNINILSEITFVDADTLGNANIPEQENLMKFIYHGNGMFSLKPISELDPEIEYSRIYYISNDDSKYENNSTTNFTKPARTIARICDVPTSFIQLTKIKHLSPTIIIDNRYVRSDTPYNENDKNMIWNDKSSKLMVKLGINGMIFSEKDDLDIIANPDEFNEYMQTGNINPYVNLSSNDECMFEIHSGGYGYNVGDRFVHVLCGISIIGIVTAVNTDGVALDIIIENISDLPKVNINNLTNRVMLCKTTAIDGVGDGLLLRLTVNESVWGSIVTKYIGPFDEIHAFKFDEYDDIWIWEYDIYRKKWIKHCRFTGDDIQENIYDDKASILRRNISDVFIRNILSKSNNIFVKANYMRDYSKHKTVKNSSVSDDINIDTEEDLSPSILNLNIQDSVYLLTESDNFHDTHDIICINKYHQSINNMNKYILPRFHNLNLREYHNKSNMLTFSYDNEASQPIPFIFNPIKDEICEYDKICRDVYKFINRHEFTFADIFDNTNNEVFDSTGILTRNIYFYNEISKTPEVLSVENHINSLNHHELISYIIDNLGYQSEPVQFEGSDYEFTDSMLKEYIIQNTYNSPIYKKNDIFLARQKGEIIVEKSDSVYKGVGEQPKGLYVEISGENFNSEVYIDDGSVASDSNILYMFYVYDHIDSFKGFRIIDEDGYDISEISIIICNKGKMIFREDDWVLI